MNPYDFVRLDRGRPPQRGPAPRQDRFDGWYGHIEATITALTPIFLPDGHRDGTFAQDAASVPFIPGSSLKGLFRSLIETVAPGCWRLFDGVYERGDANYRELLPPSFRPCAQNGQLCLSCRLFGLVARDSLQVGRVSFSDARCTQAEPHPVTFTPILSTPKPHHDAWYLDADGQHVAGRKFYFHQAKIQTLSSLVTSRGGPQNSRIAPLNTGSVFRFRADFRGIDDGELSLLLYAIALEPELRHKLGYAKPAGFGSVHIQLERLRRQTMAQRYARAAAEECDGPELDAFVAAQTAGFTANRASITLQDLRRIWTWPPVGDYAYPTRAWFRDHPRDPIRSTDEQA